MSVKKKRGSELTAKQSRFAAQDGIFTVQPPVFSIRAGVNFADGLFHFTAKPIANDAQRRAAAGI